MKKITPAMLLCASSILSTGINADTLSSATFVSLTGSTSFTPSDAGGLFGFDSAPLSDIMKFDSSLGTLDSATITIMGDIFYDVTIDGFDVADDSMPNSLEVDFSVGVGAAVPIGAAIHLRAFDSIFDSVSCFADPFSGPCFEIGGGMDILTPTDVFTGSDLAAFIGTGMPIDPFTAEGSLKDISIDLIFGIDTFLVDNLLGPEMFADFSFEGDVIVEYAFSAVPVPAAVWLFGSGLLGLIGVARRR